MTAVPAGFRCSALETPCELDDRQATQTDFAQALSDPPPPRFLVVGADGIVLRQGALPAGTTSLLGHHVGSLFPGLSPAAWAAAMADCRLAPRSYVWRFDDGCGPACDGHPCAVDCVGMSGRAGAPEWLLRFTPLSPDEHGLKDLRLLAQAAHQAGDAVLITCAGGLIEYVNPAFERSTGYRAREVLGRSPGMLKSGRHGGELYARLWNTIRRGEVFRTVFTNRRKDGELYFEEKTISPIFDEQRNIAHFVATSKDVSERVRAQDQLEYLASMDTLTDLPNRRLFIDRLRQAMRRADRAERQLAVLFIDLDRFKVINDTLGHSIGDSLLVEVASRLRECVRGSDTVARLGGDEFTILLEEVAGQEAVTPVVVKLLKLLGQSVRILDREFFISASVGIALYPDNGRSIDELLSRADLSMYQAKSAGRNTFRFYEQSMDQYARSDLSVETALHGALDRGEFFVVYQPVVDTRSGRVVAVEALLRWNSPAHGVVSPDRFIPILEETGLIVPVSRWSLRQALAALRQMQRLTPDIRLAFNLSGRQLHDEHLVQDVAEALREAGVEPRMLELEITESTLMEDIPRTSEMINALADMGISFAIDDFGTGYSSLSYLMRFSVRTLKIDRSFVRELRSSSDAVTIVRAIMSLAGSMGLEIVAEGVESTGQLAQLSELGCHRLQGYLFGRPSLPEDLQRLRCFEARPRAE